MTKRIALMALVGLMTLTSCVTDTIDSNAIKKTRYANLLFQNVKESLYLTASDITLCYYANLWRTAATNEERYEIEDKYFANFKIREIGDTLHFIGTGVEANHLNSIVTHGKEFNTLGTMWEVNKEGSSTTILNTAENHWKCQEVDGTNDTKKLLELSCGSIDDDGIVSNFRIKGEGTSLVIEDEKSVNIVYKIDEELITNRKDMIGQQEIVDGKLTLTEVGNEAFPAEVEFITSTNYTITYHDFTEVWSNDYTNTKP